MDHVIRIHPADTVAVALRDLRQGEIAEGVTVAEPVRQGHKIALSEISAGESIIKYGCPIGVATQDIRPGAWVHSHNLHTCLSGTLDYTYSPEQTVLPPEQPLMFDGYRRSDGRVGVRNEVWIIPTVGCVNSIGKEIVRQLTPEIPSGVDGLTAYAHPYGCSQLGDDHAMTRQALCGLIRHPNAGGVLVLGLGCENNNLEELKSVLGPVDQNQIKFLKCQDYQDEIVAAGQTVQELLRHAAGYRREPCDVSSLTVGLKCGGSDGLSGITANPLFGRVTDRLVAAGGTAILTEVPEMFGAEQLLMNRSADRAVFDKTVEMINGFKEYYLSHNQPVGENPSPGNREGGITTLEEKSLGCIQKGGTAPVVDVLAYGQAAGTLGLNLLEAPGNDLVSSAALAISGVQLLLFSTGRGTPFGCPIPTIKVSSNSGLALKKPHWIDFDAGRLVGGKAMESLTDELLSCILDIASGKKRVVSEAMDKSDLAIFKNGVTL